MATTDYRQELRLWSERLIAPGGLPGEWFAAGNALYALFKQISGIDERDAAFREDVVLPSGKAIAPLWAALCLKDCVRTRAFLRGTLAAIEEAHHKFPGEKIHVLYAGCGPFATLMLPLVPFLAEGSVEFTLLDVAPKNIELVQKMVAAFGAAPFVREIVQADATSFQPVEPVHIVVVEMMQVGLRSEPQVAAVAHLASCLKPGGVMIPERIDVFAGLLHPGQNTRRMTDPDWVGGPVYHLLEPGFSLTAAPADWQMLMDGRTQEIPLPADRDPAYSQLCLFSTLNVYGEERLNVWDSGLTQPVLLHRLEAEERPKALHLWYRCGSDPGFEFRLL